jgi:hypothetical protein
MTDGIIMSGADMRRRDYMARQEARESLESRGQSHFFITTHFHRTTWSLTGTIQSLVNMVPPMTITMQSAPTLKKIPHYLPTSPY